MPRRNLNLLCLLALLAAVCYRKADSSHRQSVGRMFETFTEVSKEIEEHYVRKVDERDIFEGALQGMVSRLDKHSQYIPPRQNEDFTENLKGEYGGIGIEISWDRQNKVLSVFSPIVGSPAFEKGIMAGDRILEIDGTPLEAFADLEATRQRLRGEIGAAVRLKILRAGREPFEVELTRARIRLESVRGDARFADGRWNFMLAGQAGVGYVRVTGFSDQTVADLRVALDGLRAQDCRALILDLRNNAGGLLEAAVEVSDLFLSEGTIVSIRGRDPADEHAYSATGKGPFTDWKMAVLVNPWSASASEIVAACLQDHGRAAIVGQRTYGKGSVQEVIPLEDGQSSLKLTTATYWRPSGQNIDRGRDAKEEDPWGVAPSPALAVQVDEQTARLLAEDRRRRDGVGPPPPVEAAPTNGDANSPVTSPTSGEAPAAREPPIDAALQKAIEHVAPAPSAAAS